MRGMGSERPKRLKIVTLEPVTILAGLRESKSDAARIGMMEGILDNARYEGRLLENADLLDRFALAAIEGILSSGGDTSDARQVALDAWDYAKHAMMYRPSTDEDEG